MLGYGLLAVVVVAAALLRLILGRFADLPPGSRLVFGVSLGAAIVGASLSIAESYVVAGHELIDDWPSVAGRVVGSRVIGERAIRPEITYEYAVDGVTYRGVTDLGVPMFGGKRKKYDVAEKLAAQYPVGGPVVVYYDPDSTGRSTLTRRLGWDVWGKLSVGLVLCFLGLLGVTLPRRRAEEK
ncbi:MAG: DUF3592 domain-containing protein [Candidatus Zixiibacteriota bacterium]|nr:MAG: DUF3592 domain-containing protein [candidate division Zixibacteria bacterium]